ncbi:MAG: ATP-binding protein [Bacillota bacterium]
MLSSLPFVGRRDEQAALLDRVGAVATGRGGMVLIGGEAGVGKTALVQRVMESSGVSLWAVGRCPGEAETPLYGPWLEIVARLRREPGWDIRDLPEPLGTAAGEWSASELAQSLISWFDRHRTPVTVILEDLHWADTATLHLTRHLVHRLAEAPLLVIATYRADELDRRHPLWSWLPEAQRLGAIAIKLERLQQPEVEELARACLAPDVSPRAAELVYRRTGGLTLFVRELLDWASRTGQPIGDGSPLPETVQQALDRRLDRIPRSDQAVLEAAAVMGPEFTSSLLERATGVPGRRLARALARAVSLNVLRRLGTADDRFAFAHALLREVLLAHLVGPELKEWHRRIAAALEEEPQPDLAALAFHLQRSGDPRAAEFLTRAGDRALRLGAVSEAQAQYQQALQAVRPDSAVRPELLLKLGWCHRWTSREPAASLWHQALETATAGENRAVAVWARHFLVLADDGADETHRLAEVMNLETSMLEDPTYRRLEMELLGRRAGYPRTGALYVSALAKHGNLAAAQDLLDRLRQQAFSDSGPELLHAGMALALLKGDLTGAAALCGRGVEAALAVRNYRDAVRLKANQVLTLLIGPALPPEELDEAAAALQRLESEMYRQSGLSYLPRGFSLAGVYQFFRGDWDGARHNVVECVRRDPAAFGGTLSWYAGRMLLQCGDPAAARPLLEALPPLQPSDPIPVSNHFAILAHTVRAELYLALGREADARTWLEAAERWPLLASAPFFRANLHLARALHHRRTGDLDAAWGRAQAALDDARAVSSSHTAIRAWRLLGELAAQGDARAEARGHFDAALTLAESCRFPFESALTRLSRGLCLAGSAGAAADLEAARSFFSRVGATVALAAAESESPRRTPASVAVPAVILTQRETQVIALVARGLTDRQIAAELVISSRTVDRHLRNISAKLGVSNRTALASYAIRAGLAD